MNFIEKLIINKAQHLAFYFMINGLIDYSKLNIGTLTIAYKDKIKDLYEIVKNDLETEARQFPRKNFEIIGCLIAQYNNLHSHINRFNYGTEGHIIQFLPDFDEPINEAINKPINAVINDNRIMKNNRYFDYLKNYLKCFNENQKQDDKNPYTLTEYFKKIGIDIAIYEFLKPLNHTKTPKPLDHTTIPNPIDFDKLMDLFFKSMEEAYAEYNNKIFFNNMKEIYRKIINEKEEDSKNMKKKQDKDRIKLLQQYFNLYKYPNKKINDNNIVFYNTVKIKFSDFDSIIRHIYNDKTSKKFQRKLLDIFTIDETSNDFSSKSSKKIDKYMQTSPIKKDTKGIETQTSPYNKDTKISDSKSENKKYKPILLKKSFGVLKRSLYTSKKLTQALEPGLEPILKVKSPVKSSSLSLSKSIDIDLTTPKKETNLRNIEKYIRHKNKYIAELFRILQKLTTETYYYIVNIENILELYKKFIKEFKLFLRNISNKDEIADIKKLFDIFSYLFKLFETYEGVQYKKAEYDKLKLEYDNLKVFLKEKLKIINLKIFDLDNLNKLAITTSDYKKKIKKMLKQNLKYYTSLYKIYGKETVFEKTIAYLDKIKKNINSLISNEILLQLLKKHYKDIVIKVLEQYTQNPKIQDFLTKFQEIIKDETKFKSLRDNFRKEFSQVFR